MVFGVHLQVLRQLPDARRRERDLDLGRARVLLTSPVLGDQIALDCCLFCQTEAELYRLFDYRPFHTISTDPSDRGSAPARQAPGPPIPIPWAWPRLRCPGGLRPMVGPEGLGVRTSGLPELSAVLFHPYCVAT